VIGRGEILRHGARVALLGYGAGVSIALDTADRLDVARGITATVADARFAKPLDADLIAALAARHDLIVTVEDNALAGGFGSAVAELMMDRGLGACRLLRCGLPDSYVGHGDVRRLRQDIGLTPASIADRVAEVIGLTAPAATAGAGARLTAEAVALHVT
jgi:1-deoxy-D-xylulose-5-phosphate synthase